MPRACCRVAQRGPTDSLRGRPQAAAMGSLAWDGRQDSMHLVLCHVEECDWRLSAGTAR
ncbi:protein of unknown function [Paraburkholderia kururiensis]